MKTMDPDFSRRIEIFWRENYNNLCIYCRSRLRGYKYDPEEAASDTIARACIFFYTFNRTLPIGPWIFGIAHNICETIKKKLMTSSTEPVDPLTFDKTPEENNPIISLNNKIDLDNCLKKLSDDEEEIYRLKRLHDKTYKEISKILHIPRATLGYRFKRIDNKVKRCLAGR